MKRTGTRQRKVIVSALHKGFVWTCIGVTTYGFSILGYRFYNYLTITRPKFEEQKRLANLRLLAEGSSDNLKDIAPSIS